MPLHALCIILEPLVNSYWSYSPETPHLGQIGWFLEPCDLAIWRMTLRNNRAPLLCYFKLFASFRSHWWIQTGTTVRKPPIWVKIDDFFLALWPCNLTFDLKNNRAPFPFYFNLVHHFVDIGEFNLELQSGNAQFGSKSTLFRAVWPRNLTADLEKQ